jgi:ferric-dicitrate binding protein FerR (iron transport regulator)
MKMGCVVVLLAAQSGVMGLENPVASMVSMGPVQFNKVRFSAEAVYFWPVLPEDDVATESTTATVLFPDKSRITLDRTTHIKFSRRGGNTTVTLIEGKLGYRLAPGSPIQIVTSDPAIDLIERSGVVSVQAGKVTLVRGRSTFTGVPDPPPRQLPSLGMYLPVQ